MGKKVILGFMILAALPSFASQSRTWTMYAPATGEHEVVGRLVLPTGKTTFSNGESKLSGFMLSAEYSYGFNEFVALNVRQGLYTDNKTTTTSSGSSSEYKRSGVGNTSLGVKALIPVDMVAAYYAVGYDSALLAKPKENHQSNEDTAVNDRNKLYFNFGGDVNFGLVSIGGTFDYNNYLDTDYEIVSSNGTSTTWKNKSGGGHTLGVHGQLNFQPIKAGLSLQETVQYEYDSSVNNTTQTNSATTYRTYTLYAIAPFTQNLEGHFSVSKLDLKDSPVGANMDYYMLMGGVRATF